MKVQYSGSNNVKATAMSKDDFDDEASEMSSTAPSQRKGGDDDSNSIHEKEIKDMLDMENKFVSFWRALVALTLILTSVLVTYLAYDFLKKEDMRDFDVGVSTVDPCSICTA
jgi:hypothetical protein